WQANGGTAPGTPSAIVQIVPDKPLPPGDYTMRVRSQAPAGSETMSMPVRLPAASQASGAVFIRRGPATGNREMPTADLRFRRSEQLRVEIPAAGSDSVSARLLDRSGKALSVPLATAVRDDADGSRWQTAQLALAPLAVGDYV